MYGGEINWIFVMDRFSKVRIAVLALGTIVVSSLPASGQLDREAIERDRMKANNVKVCEQYTHKYVKGVPKENGYLTTKTTYDRSGNPLIVINYRANGDESSRLYYEYDSKGHRIEYRKEEAWKDDRTGKVSMRTFFKQRFTYNSRGNKRSEVGFDGAANYRVMYNYLPNGKLADITRYDGDNSISERWTYSYDGNKQIIEVMPKNRQPYRVEKEFDKQGRLLLDKQIGQDKQEMRRVEFTYASDGSVATETEYYAGKLRSALRYVYDGKGQLVVIMQRNPGGAEIESNAYQYDRDGNLVEERWIDSDPKLVSTKVSEFGTNGDMVKMESYYAPYRYRVMYSYKYEKF